MATKLKKEDFNKYKVNGFKIGDSIYSPEVGIQAEIIAIDLEKNCEYDIMIDATQAELEENIFIDVPIEDCHSDTVYYRKKALKGKYDVWINSAKIQHVHVGEISVEEVTLER